MSDSSDEGSASSDEYPRKRRRKQSKEDRMLGVFGSDEEDESSDRLGAKTLHNKSVSFQRAGSVESEDEWNARPSFGSFQRQKLHAQTDLKHEATESEHVHESSEAIKSRPVFGTFTDGSEVFIPVANPTRSTQTSYRSDRLPDHAYRPRQHDLGKIQKTEDASTTRLQSGKAARMMAMMGYKSGEGLGLNQKGIVKPIEAHLRAGQKAGLGSVNERSGEDSSPSHQFKEKATSVKRVPGKTGQQKKPKVVYKTAEEIQRDAGGGLTIPKSLSMMIDMRGPETKKITNPSGSDSTELHEDANQTFRVSQRARAEVEGYASEWRTLQERKTYVRAETQRLESELQETLSRRDVLHDIDTFIVQTALEIAQFDDANASQMITQLETFKLRTNFHDSSLPFEELTLVLLTPIYKAALSTWNIYESPNAFLDVFRHIHSMLPEQQYGKLSEVLEKPVASSFDSFMTNVWYSHVRVALSGTWKKSQSRQVLDFLETWKVLTPRFMQEQIIDQLVLPHLSSSIRKLSFKEMTDDNAISWLFAWLPYLDHRDRDLIAALKRKLISALAQWNLKDGMIKGIAPLRELIGSTELDLALSGQILPKLANELRRNFVVDPQNQSLASLNVVLSWEKAFTPEDMAELLRSEMFPKWTSMLYTWLSTEPDYEEISEWYEWWQKIIPENLLQQSVVQECFRKGLSMMDTAIEQGPAALVAPAIGPSKPLDHRHHVHEQKTARKQLTSVKDSYDEEVTFKDVVEAWCAKQNYLILPLRKAHQSGNAMYRITANAKGLGGAIVYLRGDVVMLQSKDKMTWSASSLEDVSEMITRTS